MAQKPLKGVSGVLGGLISESPSEPEPQPESGLKESPKSREQPEPKTDPKTEGISAGPTAVSEARPRARRGRPPGTRAGEPIAREKVTLRLSADLMAEYREWSWEERCQLGELVERALSHYRKQRQRKAQAEKPEMP